MGTGTPGATPAVTIPAELAAACADVAIAGHAEVAAAARPRFVAAPASTAEAAGLLSTAARLGLTVVPRGSGSRLHWGSPPTRCDLVVDTRRLDRVLEHAAGDLVVQVQAGVALDDLAAVLRRGGQRLALDPIGAATSNETGTGTATGTVGGVLATNSAGPLRYRYGAPRDLLIGITVVRPDGVVARSGGKVVKNVAGYDLGKLFAGSYGTLGLITEATFRLHPLPDVSTWLTLQAAGPEAAADAVHVICDSPLWPSAVELDWPSADAPLAVSVLLEGDQASVAERVGRMQALVGPGQNVAKPVSRARAEADGTCVRVAFWVGQLGRALQMIRTAGEANGFDPVIRGSAGAGILDVWVAAAVDAAHTARFVVELRAGLAALSAGGVLPSVASAVVVWAPKDVREAVDVWGPAPSLGLMRSIKDQFDPEHRMAPGRFAGGI